MASIFDNGIGYGPVGRPGSYSFETVTLPSGATYVWKPFENKWDLTNQAALTGDDGINKISTINNYVIRISSNVNGATIYTNGQKTSNTAPKTLNVIKSSFVGRGDIRYELKKDGYIGNTYYIVRLVNNNGQQRPGYFLQTSNNNILGLSSTKIRVEKYVDGNLQQSYDADNSFVDLRFDLEKEPKKDVVKPKVTTVPLVINISGIADGVLIRSNNGEEIEVGKGRNSFVRAKGESFSIQTQNPSLYRISEIEIKDKNRFFGKAKGDTIKANNAESAKTKFTLDTPTTVNVTIAEVKKITPRPPLPPPQDDPPIGSPTPAPQPVIRLTPSPEEGDPRIYRIDRSSKLHNINSKTGLPLAFRKNADVESVTVFVGDETFEYNNLGDGEVAGIVIPAKAFKKIGRYDIKMIPFSLDELEETRREISRRGVTREVVTEETKYVEVRVPKPIPRPIPKPIPRPLPPKEEIVVKPKPPKPKPPKPPTPPKPVVFYTGGTGGGGGRGGGGTGEGEFISDFNERRRIPNPNEAGGFDNSDGSRVRRGERLL